MIINISNRNDKVSNAISERVHEWLEVCQQRHDNITSAQITLDKHEREDEVEATLHVAGKELHAKASGSNLYMAFDALEAKIERQLDKQKDKQQAKRGSQSTKDLNLMEPEAALEPA